MLVLKCQNCGHPASQPLAEAAAAASPVVTSSPADLAPRSAPTLTDSSESEARAALAAARKQLSFLDQQLEALELVQLRLFRERRKAQSFLDSNQTILSPVKRLPPEIIVEIVRQATGYDRVDDFQQTTVGIHAHCPDILDVKSGLWAYSRVCSHWRSVILANSILWSTILLMPPTFPRREKLESIHENTLSRALKRAGSSPLTVRFALTGSVNLQYHGRLIRQLVARRHLWRHIYLQVPGAPVLALLDVKGRLPLLERLSIDDAALAGCFTQTPLLREVHLRYVGPSPHLSILPWPQISSSHADLDLFLSGPIPESVRVTITHGRCGRLGSKTIPTMLELPRLHDIQVDDFSWLDRLDVPCLRSVTITDLSSRHWDRLTSLVTRCSCSLNSLSIYWLNPGTRWDELDQLLHAVPSLCHLHLGIMERGQLVRIHDILRAASILPVLQHLSFDVGIHGLTGDLDFLDVVEQLSSILRHRHASAGIPTHQLPPLRYLDITLRVDPKQRVPSVSLLHSLFPREAVGGVQVSFFIQREEA